MSTQIHPPVDTPRETPANTQGSPYVAQWKPDGRLVAGVVLIAFGLLTLLATLVNSDVLGLSIVPILGITFLVWGLLARLPGLLIPGGILTGLGAGILLSQYAFSSISGDARGGIIVLGLGLGFIAILPLTWIISPVRHWWALIPGTILTFIGIALLAGGAALGVAELLGRLWPIAPIAVGVFLIWQMIRKR